MHTALKLLLNRHLSEFLFSFFCFLHSSAETNGQLKHINNFGREGDEDHTNVTRSVFQNFVVFFELFVLLKAS